MRELENADLVKTFISLQFKSKQTYFVHQNVHINMNMFHTKLMTTKYILGHFCAKSKAPMYTIFMTPITVAFCIMLFSVRLRAFF